MTLQEFYQQVGNYEDAVGRLGSEARIRKYLARFRQDTTFSQLCQAVDRKDPKEAFLFVHNLKGLYLNLAMTQAGQSASFLCEALRGGSLPADLPALLGDLRANHDRVLAALAALLDAPGEGGTAP